MAPDNPALKEAAELQCLGPELVDDLREDPHRFFRFVAHSFVSLSCVRVAQGPLVNLHGDVHLEQYLVSSLGRGLGDFDDAGIGPVGVDLLRIATSIRIASRVRAWDADGLWGRLLGGYVRALDAPDTVAAEPAFAHRARAGFHNDHARLLAWTKTVFKPVSDEEAASVRIAYARYVAGVVKAPLQTPSKWDVVEIGQHTLGVGSYRTKKYLLRIRGDSDSESDDRILEVKEVLRNPGATCIPDLMQSDPLRVLAAANRLAYVPFPDAAPMKIWGRTYIVHEWVDDYVELDVNNQELDETQMLEVVYDIGVQLGRGHPKKLRDPYEAELRAQLRSFVRSSGLALWIESEHASEEVWSAWSNLNLRANYDSDLGRTCQ